jgi:hypothetical protein
MHVTYRTSRPVALLMQLHNLQLRVICRSLWHLWKHRNFLSLAFLFEKGGPVRSC